MKSGKDFVISILNKVGCNELDNVSSGFSSNKNAIVKLFSPPKDENREDIFLRLTVIDSMYSTQMNRRYYGLDELADALIQLKKKHKSLSSLFLNYLQSCDSSLFDYIKEEKGHKSNTNLLKEGYGIDKDGNDKGIAISLISKYAYFETKFKFPIYDSIACEMLPVLWKYCGMNGKCPSLAYNGKIDGKEKLQNFINTLKSFITNLGCDVSYDHLDRLLWFVGKIRRGNLSLVLSRTEYDTIPNARNFNIDETDLSTLKFLKKGSVLYDFFMLAKELRAKK